MSVSAPCSRNARSPESPALLQFRRDPRPETPRPHSQAINHRLSIVGDIQRPDRGVFRPVYTRAKLEAAAKVLQFAARHRAGADPYGHRPAAPRPITPKFRYTKRASSYEQNRASMIAVNGDASPSPEPAAEVAAEA